ncbi:MAG: hypothetical protein Satyrvirus6_15 [Satyrvirus sp.]|uniref:Uncharacterized protein n=1 Tax=Satyrvirus sp. TaxID=2487771 RepID=A0A3G5AH40_9VIRU|nr:MAG: hypothetical protein Satyrvirus6_15 [Satyrvirus sp.]
MNKIPTFIESCMDGSLDNVKYWITKNIDIHENDDYGLRWASLNGHFPVVKFLVESGANVRAANNQSLIWTTYNGHLDIAKYLIESGANINIDNDYVLRWVLRNDKYNSELIKYLIGKGADLNILVAIIAPEIVVRLMEAYTNNEFPDEFYEELVEGRNKSYLAIVSKEFMEVWMTIMINYLQL